MKSVIHSLASLSFQFFEEFTELWIYQVLKVLYPIWTWRAVARPIGVMQCSLTLVTDALGEGASALAGDVYEARIAGDLVEHGQDPLRFRQKAAVQIRFEL